MGETMHLVTGTEVQVEELAGSGSAVQGLAGWLLEAATRLLGLKWGNRPARQKQMRVVETLAIGPKKQLVLVSCGGERFLVGTGADSVQTIVRVRPESGEAAVAAPAKSFGDLC